MDQISACTLDCPDVCSLIIQKKEDGRIVFRGNPDHPFTRGFICRKGVRYPRILNHKNRITTPLIKKGDVFRPIGWDDALNLCAEKLRDVQRRPESILHLRSYGYTGVLAQASQIFFGLLGSGTLYGSLCDDTGIEACIRDFGSLNHNDPEDLMNAGRIVNWGKDLERYSVHLASIVRQSKKNGVRMLSISPGGDGVESYSDNFVRIRPGMDRFLAAAVIAGMLNKSPVSDEVVRKSSNLSAFKAVIERASIDDLCTACDVSRGDLDLILDYYLDDGPIASIIGWGVQRYKFGGETVRFINALAFLSGNIGIEGGGSYFNISSARNLTRFPFKPPVERKQFLLPNIAEEMQNADPSVRFVWVDGSNIVNQVPGSRSIADALRSCGFVVVVDAFMTDTALCADLVLPCALVGEREDIKGSCLHNYINYSGKALVPPGEARCDYDILADLGRRLSPAVDLPSKTELFECALNNPAVDIDLMELKEKGYARTNHSEVAYKDRFDHPDGKFHFVEKLSPEPERDDAYPLTLLTLINREYMHSQIPEDEQRGVPTLYISDENPQAGDAGTNKRARLVSPIGSIEVKVEISPGLHPEAVIIRRGGWMKFGRSANELIQPALTDMGYGTAYYSQKVRLEWCE